MTLSPKNFSRISEETFLRNSQEDLGEKILPKIDYKIFLKKFENAGIRGNTLQWFESNLTRQGAKSQYKWYLLEFIRNIRDGSCSRIKSKLFTVYYICE